MKLLIGLIGAGLCTFVFGAGRVTTSTPIYVRMRAWQPPPKWLSPTSTATCTYAVRLKNLSKIEQHLTLEYDNLRAGLSLFLDHPPAGISWPNMPASGSGWHTVTKDFAMVSKNITLTAEQYVDEAITVRCSARKDGNTACALEPPGPPGADFGHVSAWGASGIDCTKTDVVCGASMSFSLIATVKVAEDRGAVMGRVRGSCSIENAGDGAILEQDEVQLNGGRPF